MRGKWEYGWEDSIRRKVESRPNLEGKVAELRMFFISKSLCTKFFPQQLWEETGLKASHYYASTYRWSPVHGELMKKRTFEVRRRQVQLDKSNWWIASYNPMLSKSFSCQISMELCVPRLGQIKYLFKYVCIERYRATIQLRNKNARHEEIRNFMNVRYVSAWEAAWRILGFGYVDKQSLVVGVAVHLKGHYTVVIPWSNWVENSPKRKPRTQKTKYFESDKVHQTARRLLHYEYAMYFIWNNKGKSSKPRAVLKVHRKTNDETPISDKKLDK